MTVYCQQSSFTVCLMLIVPVLIFTSLLKLCFCHMTLEITSLFTDCSASFDLIIIFLISAEELMSQSSSQVRVSAEVEELRFQLGRLNIRNKELELQNSGRSNDHARMLKQASHSNHVWRVVFISWMHMNSTTVS